MEREPISARERAEYLIERGYSVAPIDELIRLIEANDKKLAEGKIKPRQVTNDVNTVYIDKTK